MINIMNEHSSDTASPLYSIQQQLNQHEHSCELHTIIADSTVITASAKMAPPKMVSRLCRIAMMAAMKKVLSPDHVYAGGNMGCVR